MSQKGAYFQTLKGQGRENVLSPVKPTTKFLESLLTA